MMNVIVQTMEAVREIERKKPHGLTSFSAA